MKFEGTSPRKLRTIKLTLISPEKCRKMYRKKNFNVTSEHLCTLNKVGEGACSVSSLWIQWSECTAITVYFAGRQR